MTAAEYRKVRAGAVVRTRRSLSNRLVSIPRDTNMVVTYKHGGLELEGPKCTCCGIKAVISKVDYTDVDLIRLVQEGTV